MIGNEKAQLCTGSGDELCIENQRYLRKIDASEGKEAEEKGTNLLASVFFPARTKNAPNPPLRCRGGKELTDILRERQTRDHKTQNETYLSWV